MSIESKILKARKMIRETPVKKEGTNSFSRYDYFTPSQVTSLVGDVCQKLNILALFSLKKDEHGHYGELKIIDCSNTAEGVEPEWRTTYMRTEMPEIKATNAAQQMGGMDTYCRRYMLMSAFDITDNNLDFDSQDNRPKAPTKPPQKAPDAQSPVNDEIALNIDTSTSMKELTEIWGKLDTLEKSKYGDKFTKRKIEITTK